MLRSTGVANNDDLLTKHETCAAILGPRRHFKMWPFTISEEERMRLIKEEKRRHRIEKLKFWKRPVHKVVVPTLSERLLSSCLPVPCLLGLICILYWRCTRKWKVSTWKSTLSSSPAQLYAQESLSLTNGACTIIALSDHTRSMRDRRSCSTKLLNRITTESDTSASSNVRNSKIRRMLTRQEALSQDRTHASFHPEGFKPHDETLPSLTPRFMARHSIMPIVSTKDDIIDLTKKNRSRSLERKASRVQLNENARKPPGTVVLDFLEDNTIEYQGSMSSILDDNVSLVSACSHDLERLAQTIDKKSGSRRGDEPREQQVQEMQVRFFAAQRQGSIGSIGMSSTGSFEKSDVLMKHFLARRRGSINSMHSSNSGGMHFMRALGDNNEVVDRPHMTRSSSKNSISTMDSSLFGAFYDPTVDAPPYLTIYYATQSGTSEYYAYALQQEGQAMGLDVGICNVNNVFNSVDSMNLDHELSDILVPHVTKANSRRGRAVFLISTHHDGGPTADGINFLKMLENLKNEKYLKGLRYAVFGFGNSTYTSTFNSQSKIYDHLLATLGAKRMAPLALGDDSMDVDWDFEQWKWKIFWPKFADLSAKDYEPLSLPCAGKVSQESIKKYNPKSRTEDPDSNLLLEYIEEADMPKHKEKWEGVDLLPSARHFRGVVEYKIKSIRPLWRDPDLSNTLKQSGSTMHMEIDLNEPNGIPFKFNTGDSLSVLPVNRSSIVKALAKKLGLNLGAIFILRPKQGIDEKEFELPFPTPCTVRDYLSKYCELSTPPRRSVVRALSKCATDCVEREEMYKLSSKKHRQEYLDRIVKEHVGLAEFITNKYPSIKISLITFVGLCAAMRTRWYTASSSTLMHPDSVHLTFNVVSIIRPSDKSICRGCGSHYLAKLKPGHTLRVVFSRNSGFVAPPDHSSPLILIANGSGIAPMRALIQERHFQKSMLNFPVGLTELFFGIRRRDLDFLYQDEFTYYNNSGSLSSLYLACSREQMHKIYVQHLVAKHSKHVWKLLKRGAFIYVCGSSAMRTEVDQVLRAIISRQIGDADVLDFMKTLVAGGRYVHEAFDANHML